MIKKIKTLASKLAVTIGLVAGIALPLAAHAGNPLTYIAVFTNDIPAGTAVTVPVTQAINTVRFTNAVSGSTVQSNYFDTLQSKTITLVVSERATVQGAGGYVTASNFLNTIVSPDGITWVPGPTVPVLITQSNCWQGSLSNIDATGFRYITPTNIINYMTNCAVSNANFKVELFLKGP